MIPEARNMSYERVSEVYNSVDSIAERSRHPFGILLGPSGVGKSTIIRDMVGAWPDKYVYIKPYTTRPLREGETDKISVSIEQYCDMEERGMFAYDNPLYGVRYGTPIEPIRNAYTEGKIPLLDFPLKDLNKLQLPGDIALVGIYCFPPSIKTWMNRITRDARANMSRVFAARELWRLQDTQYLNSNIHFAIINSEGESLRASNEIHDFLQKKYS